MLDFSTVGVDLAKNVIQVHGINADGKAVVRRQLRRRRDCQESCAGSVLIIRSRTARRSERPRKIHPNAVQDPGAPHQRRGSNRRRMKLQWQVTGAPVICCARSQRCQSVARRGAVIANNAAART